MTHETALSQLGWCKFPKEAALTDWVQSVRGLAAQLIQDPDHRADWLRCGGTWFAGVNLLPNDQEGRVRTGPALRGDAIEFITKRFGPQQWDRAQLSVIYPGYPRKMAEETEAAFRFRLKRDAAHVDGLLPMGPARRRHLQEPHAFVLGLPLVETSANTSPMVVWEGSHHRMRAAFRSVLEDVPPDRWTEIDLTEIYQHTRKICFETCRRVSVSAKPGEAYVIDRLALHGVAPWKDSATAPNEGRVIAYFRPELRSIASWLDP